MLDINYKTKILFDKEDQCYLTKEQVLKIKSDKEKNKKASELLKKLKEG